MERIISRIGYKDGERFAYFLASDLHIDEPGFDEALFKKEFDAARAENARIYLNGDILGLILPGDMKRYTPSSDQYHEIDGKINKAIEHAEALLKPYVDLIDMIGCGNHETAVLKHHSVDATKLLIGFLNRSRNPKLSPIRHGGYTGFIRLIFEGVGRGHVQNYDIYYNHGQGTGGDVTDGLIGLKRREYISSDLIWMGHVHRKWSGIVGEEQGLDRMGNFYSREQRGVITGTYLRNLQETDASTKGYRLSFAEERMRRPQAQGGAMLRLTARRDGISAKVET